MKTIVSTVAVLACSGALLVAGNAGAHYLWIENSASGAKLIYGEADGLLKEKSPGKLDNIKAPAAFVQDTPNSKPAAAAISRGPEYFSIAGNKAAALLASEESLEVRDLTTHGLGFAKSNYYARYGRAGNSNDGSPLVLDLREHGTNAFTVVYRGQPLKGTQVEVIAPNTWIQEHKSDAQGTVEINTPWRGQYVVHVLHVDKTPGDFAGKKYESLRNHFTYTFVKSDGADPGPAVAPKRGAD